MAASNTPPEAVLIQAGAVELQGLLRKLRGAGAVVLFAHGSGSSRLSPRNSFVAERLREAGLCTLLFDLLTEEEEKFDELTAELRFDISLLTTLLSAATEWALRAPQLRGLAVAYFGASTGAAAALAAAAEIPQVTAVVSRGGRPDLAGPALSRVRAATLLIVGGNDPQVLALNQQALRQLRCEAELAVVPGATHLFVEPGALEPGRLTRHRMVCAPHPSVRAITAHTTRSRVTEPRTTGARATRWRSSLNCRPAAVAGMRRTAALPWRPFLRVSC